MRGATRVAEGAASSVLQREQAARVRVRDLLTGAALGLTVLALLLRLHGIGNQSLWLDEGYTLLFSGLPLDRLFVVGGAHEHPPLYYLIVHALSQLHQSPLLPRVVSAIAGSLSVLALYGLGTQLFGRAAGFLASILLAISPFHVWYSQNARAYELAGLLVLLSYILLFRALELPGRALWASYGLCLALALYTEYTTALVLLPHLLVLRRARRMGALRGLLGAWTLGAVLFAPWVTTLVLDASSIAADYWIPAPSFADVSGTVLEFLGLRTPCPSPPCTGSEAAFPLLHGNELLLTGIIIAAAFALLVVCLLRRDLARTMLLTWLIVPFALILVLATHRSLYLDRVFLDATYPLYLIVGSGAAWALRHSARAALMAAVVGLLIFGNASNLNAVYASPSNPDWKSPARDLLAAYRPGQAVVFNPGVLRTIVSAYLPPGWKAQPERPIWYHAYLDVPSWQDRYRGLVRSYMDDERLPLKTRLMRIDNALRDIQLRQLAGVRQIWLVTEDYAGFSDTRRWFVTHGYNLLLSQMYFNDSRIELWDRGLPRDFGPAVLPDGTFSDSWSIRGRTQLAGSSLAMMGEESASRDFPVRPGGTYVVNLNYRGIPPDHPSVEVRLYDRWGRPIPGFMDRFGQHLDTFPRTEWYDMPVNGVWLSEPFGFVAPSGAARARITLGNTWGLCYWRHIAVYRER